MRVRFIYIVNTFVVTALLGTGCVSKPQQTVARQNLSFLYNPSSTPLHPEFAVFHEAQFQSRLYIKVYPVELLFNQANPEGTYQSRLMVRFELKELDDGVESEFMADSSGVVFTLKMEEVKDAFVGNLPLHTQEGRKYILKVHTTDMNRNKATVNYIHVDRSSVNTAQNFIVIDASTGMPFFDPVHSSPELLKIQYNRRGVDSLHVRYFRNVFPLPRPPITNLRSPLPEFIVDTSYAYPYNDSTFHILPWEGLYHIQVDPEQPGGLTLLNFGENYPRIATVSEMVGPLVYLSSSVEFNELAQQSNKKLAIDNFWLQAAGNAQSARELIRVYYNRVFFANYFFTSYKEGWKTDRGMMFLVYGPPNILTKRGDTEIWVYYRKKSREPLQFTFSRHENIYSQNDYHLERNFVNSMWVQAVQDWRRGKIFYSESH